MRALLAGRLLDLQTATAAELAQLPDIGEVSAQALVTARVAGHLRCLADLAAIRGLGGIGCGASWLLRGRCRRCAPASIQRSRVHACEYS